MASYTRTRTRPSESVRDIIVVHNEYNVYTKQYSSSTGLSTAYFPLRETCVDEIHPRHPLQGGPFGCVKCQISFEDDTTPRGENWVKNGVPRLNEYIGFRVAQPIADPGLPIMTDAIAAAQNYGPTAWDRYKPKLSTVSLGQTLAEARELMPLLKQSLRALTRLPKRLNQLGQYYLAEEFGWKPLLRDIRDWYRSCLNLDQQLNRARINNSKWLKRSGTLVDQTSTSKVADPTPSTKVLPYLTHAVAGSMSSVVTTTTVEKVWFSGKFRYYIPGLDDTTYIGRMRNIRRLWGLNLTPELVYNLIPWSWLLDWFSTAGSAISNLQSASSDNLVAQYAYIMRKTESIATRLWKGQVLYTTGVWPNQITSTKDVEMKSTVTVSTKTRVAADPFGFHLTLPDFSDWQLSILAALGLSRSKS